VPTTVSTPALTLASPITDVPGVDAKAAARLEPMGLRRIADLLLHLPHRHEHEREERSIAETDRLLGDAPDAAANIALRGRVGAVRVVRGNKTRVEATLVDDSGSARLVWFNAPWLRGRLHPDMDIVVQGRGKRRGSYLEIVNPIWSVVESHADAPARSERWRPVYPASESVSSTLIEKVIETVLPHAVPLLEDHLPASFRVRRGLPSLADAYRMVHAPDDDEEPGTGRRRLAYDELLLLQLAVLMRRRQVRETMRAPALPRTDAIDAHIRGRLPFSLTPEQELVIDEIATDLGHPAPMSRLLQGDVGAGKTVVALYAMLLAVAERHQAALMAPTEILAEQHFRSIGALLADSAVRLELLTSSLTKAQREDVLERLAKGDIDIVVGTHALLTERVRFRSLAVAVIDEQHRFGVHQRAQLRGKNLEDTTLVPHVLVMTATPIPRTLAMTVLGDLDVSTLRGLPPGRQPIATRVMPPHRADEVYAHLADRIARGEQAYVVVPAVEETDHGLKDVATHMRWLAEGPLRGRRLEMLHGRLERPQREAIMERFHAGDIDALVCTVVIEVGVDVPNASAMVIEHAERFGLAQLHQLRGRIGRGQRKSLCVLIGDATTEDGAARLDAIAETTDGFRIAERDLEIRGPGEILGARQAGAAPFRAANLVTDLPLLTLARRDAQSTLEEDPNLDRPEHALLRRRLMKIHGAMMGVSDVG